MFKVDKEALEALIDKTFKEVKTSWGLTFSEVTLVDWDGIQIQLKVTKDTSKFIECGPNPSPVYLNPSKEGGTRSEHMQWCKARALAFIRDGDHTGAFTSMVSDLQKHPETANHLGIKIGTVQFLGGHLKTSDDMRNFINGFN